MAEREQYLVHLLREGVDRKVLRCCAAYQLHIIRILELTELRIVSAAEIQSAGKTWAEYTGPLRFRQYVPGAPETFVRIAKAWLEFHGKPAPPPPPPFHELLAKFTTFLRSARGLSPLDGGHSTRNRIE